MSNTTGIQYIRTQIQKNFVSQVITGQKETRTDSKRVHYPFSLPIVCRNYSISNKYRNTENSYSKIMGKRGQHPRGNRRRCLRLPLDITSRSSSLTGGKNPTLNNRQARKHRSSSHLHKTPNCQAIIIILLILLWIRHKICRIKSK